MRPDMDITYYYHVVDKKLEKHRERVGGITIHRPEEGIDQWSILQSLAQHLTVDTNYAAESLLKRELKRRDPALLKRLEWDTEGGAVGVYADAEDDIRAVAELANELIAASSTKA